MGREGIEGGSWGRGRAGVGVGIGEGRNLRRKLGKGQKRKWGRELRRAGIEAEVGEGAEVGTGIGVGGN